jgi:hypothetical protein
MTDQLTEGVSDMISKCWTEKGKQEQIDKFCPTGPAKVDVVWMWRFAIIQLECVMAVLEKGDYRPMNLFTGKEKEKMEYGSNDREVQ